MLVGAGSGRQRRNSHDDFGHGLLDQDLDDDLIELNAELGVYDEDVDMDDEQGSAEPRRSGQIGNETMQDEDVVREEAQLPFVGPQQPR